MKRRLAESTAVNACACGIVGRAKCARCEWYEQMDAAMEDEMNGTEIVRIAVQAGATGVMDDATRRALFKIQELAAAEGVHRNVLRNVIVRVAVQASGMTWERWVTIRSSRQRDGMDAKHVAAILLKENGFSSVEAHTVITAGEKRPHHPTLMFWESEGLRRLASGETGFCAVVARARELLDKRVKNQGHAVDA